MISIIITLFSIFISLFLGFYITKIIKIKNRYNNALYNIKEKPTFDEVIIKQTQRSIQHIIDEYDLRKNTNNKFIQNLIDIRNFYYDKIGLIENSNKRTSIIDKENETIKSKDYITIYDVILSDVYQIKNITLYYVIMIPLTILMSYYIPKIMLFFI